MGSRMKTLITVLSIISAIALASFGEGIPIYYFDKKKPFIFGKKSPSTDGKICKVYTPDSLYSPPNRVIIKEEGKVLFISDTSIVVDRDMYSEKSITFKIGDTLVLKSYLGEGSYSAYYGGSKFIIEYGGVEDRQQQFMKERVRFNSENWILIDKKDSCWMKDGDPSIVEKRLEF
jgi:hypothetical protein